MDLLTLTPVSSSLPSKWAYRYSTQWGDPAAVHFPGITYQLPFEPGTAFTVSQAFDRTTTHNTASNRNAIDFSVPQGTPIVAARSGIVIERVLSNQSSSTNIDHLKKANYILVAHEDGSIATYAHLQPHISYVHLGQKVRAGQRLALSGNTGYSSGPHLHFNVTVTRLKESPSVPVAFLDPASRRALPPLRTGFQGRVGGARSWQAAAPADLSPQLRPTPASSDPVFNSSTNKSSPAVAPADLSRTPRPPHVQPSPPTAPQPGSAPYKLMGLGEIASNTIADVGDIALRALNYYGSGIASPGLRSAKAPSAPYIELALPTVLFSALVLFLATLVRRFIEYAKRQRWATAGYLGLLISGGAYATYTTLSAHLSRGESPALLIGYFIEYAVYDPGGTLFLLALVSSGAWMLSRMAAPPQRLTHVASHHASSGIQREEPNFSPPPVEPSASPTPPTHSDDRYGDLEALKKALAADPNAAHRLVQYELLSDPAISPEEATRRAYRRFSS